jgi:hypothetical protein
VIPANLDRIAGKDCPDMTGATRMQTFARPGEPSVPQHGLSLRIMLLTDRPEGPTARRLAACGSLIEVEDRIDAALGGMLDDALGFDLFVMDCDAFGGIAAAEEVIASLIAGGAKMRVMLVSEEFDVPAYPMGRRTAVCLPAFTSDAGFQRGYDHVLRDRPGVTVM